MTATKMLMSLSASKHYSSKRDEALSGPKVENDEADEEVDVADDEIGVHHAVHDVAPCVR